MDVARFFTLISPTVALLIFFVVKGFISIGDVVLSMIFVIIAFVALGIQWRHRQWAPQPKEANERIRKLLLAVYKIAVSLVLIVPFLSLGVAYLLNEEAPRFIDNSAVIKIKQPPSTLPVETINLNEPSNKGTESYVAVFQDSTQNIAPTYILVKEVLGQVDSSVRWPTAWYCLLVAIILIAGLKVGELFADMNMAPLKGDNTTSNLLAEPSTRLPGH